ncbi:prolyl oligopeptidase family serine peptidase [Candidatus Acetothermia bacterium]|nr:prolyl oligopeptidase family serine peptidase [Candidatus Acetothermia bacterium]MBI3644211.1 prolyl oligopeptidase family serine peptidase [Candidatus Acetothermia bacterium]
MMIRGAVRAICWFGFVTSLLAITLHAAQSEIEITRDIIYGSADGTDLKLDIYRPAATALLPAILILHASNGTKSDPDLVVPWAQYLAGQGYLAIAVEHRLLPFYGGPGFPAQLQDVKCAVRWARANATTWNINPDRIGILGFSSGGWLAELVGTTDNSSNLEGSCGDTPISSRVQAVIAYYSPSDLLKMPAIGQYDVGNVLIGKPCLPGPSQDATLCMQASPVTYISSDDPPFLLAHGTKDTNIPFEQSELMQSALSAAGVNVELVKVEGAGHIWKIDTDYEKQVEASLISFLEKHLKH